MEERGEAGIASMNKTVRVDRLDLKKRLSGLTDEWRASGSIKARARWLNRFNEYVNANNLQERRRLEFILRGRRMRRDGSDRIK
jgi:hypothetical protein